MSVIGRLTSVLRGREGRGASALALSAVISQSIALLATPLLARLYTPEAFGYLTLVVSVSGVITPVVALRLESAIMLPRGKSSASALLAAGVVIALTLSIVSVAVLELSFALGAFTQMAQLPGFSWWVGGASFLSGLFVLLGHFALRSRRYDVVAIRNITQGAATATAQLAFGLTWPTAIGLVIGYVSGRAAGVLPLLRWVRGEVRRFTGRQMRALLVRYRAFPLLFAPAALLNAAALALPAVVIGVWFDVADAGYWGMAERITAVPLVIVGVALGQVVEARIAFNRREGQSGSARYYLRVSGALGGASILVGIAVLFLASPVVAIVLGPQWEKSVLIMQLLVPMLVTRLVAGPTSKILVVAEWATVNLVLDIVRFVLVCIVLACCRVADASLSVLVIWVALAFALIYIVTWCVGLAAARHLDSRSASS